MDIQELTATLETRVSQIHVSYKAAVVNPDYYRQVAQAIRDGRIGFRSPSQSRGTAHYLPGENRFEFSLDYSNRPSTSRSLALFVHEASHAVSDLRRIKIEVMAEEAVAYVAQTIFLEANHVKPSTASSPATQRLGSAARAVARIHLAGNKASVQLWSELERAIAAHPVYKRSAHQLRIFDGI